MTEHSVPMLPCNVDHVDTPEVITATIQMVVDDATLAELVRDALAADLTDQTDEES